MNDYKPAPLEQETIIRFSEGEPSASIYTHNPYIRKKLMKMSRDAPQQVRLIHQDDYAASFIAPKSCVSIRQPYSEERKARDSERARAAGQKPKKE